MYNTQARNDRKNRVKTLNTMYYTQAKKPVFFAIFRKVLKITRKVLKITLKDNQEGLKDNQAGLKFWVK